MIIVHCGERFTPEQFIDYVNALAFYEGLDYQETSITTLGEAIQYINQFK